MEEFVTIPMSVIEPILMLDSQKSGCVFDTLFRIFSNKNESEKIFDTVPDDVLVIASFASKMCAKTE